MGTIPYLRLYETPIDFRYNVWGQGALSPLVLAKPRESLLVFNFLRRIFAYLPSFCVEAQEILSGVPQK